MSHNNMLIAVREKVNSGLASRSTPSLVGVGPMQIVQSMQIGREIMCLKSLSMMIPSVVLSWIQLQVVIMNLKNGMKLIVMRLDLISVKFLNNDLGTQG